MRVQGLCLARESDSWVDEAFLKTELKPSPLISADFPARLSTAIKTLFLHTLEVLGCLSGNRLFVYQAVEWHCASCDCCGPCSCCEPFVPCKAKNWPLWIFLWVSDSIREEFLSLEKPPHAPSLELLVLYPKYWHPPQKYSVILILLPGQRLSNRRLNAQCHCVLSILPFFCLHLQFSHAICR